MKKHQPRHRVIPKVDFRPKFNAVRLAQELGCSIPLKAYEASDSFDYMDAHAYIERKTGKHGAATSLGRLACAAAHSFVENYRLIAQDKNVWDDLGVRTALEAAGIITVAEHASPVADDRARSAVQEGIRLGDHAVYINLPK